MIRIILALMATGLLISERILAGQLSGQLGRDTGAEPADDVPETRRRVNGSWFLPMSLPASGPEADIVACVPGCACAGSQLRPTVTCSSLNLTQIPEGLSHLITYL